MEAKKTTRGYAAPYRGKNDYYRDGSYILMIIVNVQAVIMGVLTIALAIFLCTRQTYDRYYAETAENKVRPLISLPYPNPGMQTKADWAATAASDIMTFGFNDVNVRLEQSRSYFTAEGWESFNKALETSKLLESIVKTQQIATAVPRGPAELKDEGLIKGKFCWHVEVPLLITFRAGSDIRPMAKKVRMLVESLPTKENPFGWGISQWEIR